MALSAPRRNIARFAEGHQVHGVAAGVTCIQTGLAILAAGYARPGRPGQGGNDAAKAANAATYQAVGVFLETVTGGVADGDVEVKIQAGTWNFGNSAGIDAVTVADIGKLCFIVDDETVARTSASGTRAVAGVVEKIDAEGVWVRIEPAGRGRRTVVLPYTLNQVDLLAGTPFELVSPVVGAIIGGSAIVQAAVTTGGPITLAVGVTAVDGFALVIADAATKGTVVSDAPTAGHASTVVTVGSRIQVVPDAAFATAGAVNGFVEIAY